MCSEALYRTTSLCSRRSYIVPDMLSYRNGDASMSYHVLLYRTRCCYIVTGVLLYRSSDAVSSYQMLLYRTQCCYIVTGYALSYVLLVSGLRWEWREIDITWSRMRSFSILLLVKPCIDLCRQVEIFKLMYVFLSSNLLICQIKISYPYRYDIAATGTI